MHFVIDSNEWSFEGWDDAIIEQSISRLLDRCDVARQRDEVVGYGDDLFAKPVLQGRSIWQLFDAGYGRSLPRELQERLSSLFSLAPRWHDGNDWPASFDVEVDGRGEVNPDAAWVHLQNTKGYAVACLGLLRAGPKRVRVDGRTIDIHWVTSEPEHLAFFRSAIDIQRSSLQTLELLSSHAYPNLLFLSGVWRGIGSLDGGFHSIQAGLRFHFDVLCDHGHWIFTTPPPRVIETDSLPSGVGQPSSQLIEQRFRARSVIAAPEKPEVYDDLTCRTARERTVQGRILYCHWHLKLEPNRNRLHIHAPVAESGWRVVVAIAHSHLPLP